MRKQDAIDRIKRQLAASEGLELQRNSPTFKKWHRNSEVLIEQVFGQNTRHLDDFRAVKYGLSVVFGGTPDYEFQEAYVRGLQRARAILESFIEEISEYWSDEQVEERPALPAGMSALELICARFHIVARQLRARYDERSTLEVEDEYDVQDLLHALLLIHFDDIRREEWTPSYAGGSSRVDFLLKAEQIVVEAKRARKGLHARRLGEELLIDIQRYRAHPDCRYLFCFVYDPEGRILNPRGLESDLAKATSEIDVRVAILPAGH